MVDEDVDEFLANCSEEITISYKSGPEFRVAHYFAMILADLTKGIIYDPNIDEYLFVEDAEDSFPNKVEQYENSVDMEEFKSMLEPFEDWK